VNPWRTKRSLSIDALSLSLVRWLSTSANPSLDGMPTARAPAASKTALGTHQFDEESRMVDAR